MRRWRCAGGASLGVNLKVDAWCRSHRHRISRTLCRWAPSHGLAPDRQPASPATSPWGPCRVSKLGAKMFRQWSRPFSATCLAIQKLLNQMSPDPTSIDPSPAPDLNWASKALTSVRARSAIFVHGAQLVIRYLFKVPASPEIVHEDLRLDPSPEPPERRLEEHDVRELLVSSVGRHRHEDDPRASLLKDLKACRFDPPHDIAAQSPRRPGSPWTCSSEDAGI